MNLLLWLGINSINILYFYFGYKILMFSNFIIENLMPSDKNIVVKKIDT